MPNPTTADVKNTIVRLLELPAGAPPPTDETPLADLARDSFALVQLAFQLQEELPITLEQADSVSPRTLGELATLIAGRAA